MNEDRITETTDILPETDSEKAPLELSEQNDKAETSDSVKADKRLEKLSLLKEKYSKAVSAQAAAEKRTKDITAQISKIEKELHAEEVAVLDKACKERNVSYSEIADFIRSIPENKTFADAVKHLHW